MHFSPELLGEVRDVVQNGSGKIVLGKDQDTAEGFGPLSTPLSKFLAFVPGPKFSGSLGDMAKLLREESYGYVQEVTPDQLQDADIIPEGVFKNGVLLAAK
ncbi:MAG: hypothetical protein ABIG32_01925 [Candidatus Uhrbacteria bacterium]|nr:hypothetical protein [Patescibacteria group bacterium]MBU1907299.1 hypothetical protein [Patescibacteria group bacterium]